MVVAAGSGVGRRMDRKCSFVPFLQGTLPVEKQGRADHLALPGFGSLFCPLFSSCPRVCVCVLVAVSSIADILRVPTGAGRKVLEMVSSRHTVTRHSCRCWRKTW